MKCKKCNTDIQKNEKFCSNCGERVKNNKKIIIIAGLILICLVVIICIIVKNNKASETMQENSEELTYNEENSGNEDDYVDFQRTESWYNNPVNSGEEIKMPNLVGMNCADLRDYLDNNYLYFIKDIEYQYDDNSSAFSLHVPTKVLSTIPEAGTTLDPYADKSITILAEYEYGISSATLYFEDTNMEVNNFGKTIKIEIGDNENNIIEGVIGEDFYKESRSGSSYLKYSKKRANNETWWDLIKQNKVACFTKNELIDKSPDNKYSADFFIKGKVWIDNKLVKEAEFGIVHDSIALMKKDAIKY